jgi:alkane 1-monooxygenase
MNRLKYGLFLIIPLAAFISFVATGIWSFTALFISFGLIPFIELFLKSDTSNFDKLQEESLVKDRLFDYWLYLTVPIQYGLLAYFLFLTSTAEWTTAEWVGKLSAMGILCGVLGINTAHELGHRANAEERLLSKMLLLTSLYMHFYVEHNKGHHRHVSTPLDPASARYRESLYVFWIRSIVTGYFSAWHINAVERKAQGLSFFSLKHEMLWFQLVQFGFVFLIYLSFGLQAVVAFVIAAAFGILLLETVNYIEHYGLRRAKLNERLYEKSKPIHSWNSDHPLGRIILFELSRHSDHHYQPQRKYQVLRHFEQSPQMPTGYPGMMLLALLPPLFFRKMDKELRTQNIPLVLD